MCYAAAHDRVRCFDLPRQPDSFPLPASGQFAGGDVLKALVLQNRNKRQGSYSRPTPKRFGIYFTRNVFAVRPSAASIVGLLMALSFILGAPRAIAQVTVYTDKTAFLAAAQVVGSLAFNDNLNSGSLSGSTATMFLSRGTFTL
jgi:hypothetical protein